MLGGPPRSEQQPLCVLAAEGTQHEAAMDDKGERGEQDHQGQEGRHCFV